MKTYNLQFAYLSIILLLHCGNSSQLADAELHEIGLTCMEQTGVAPVVIHNAIQGNIADDVKYKDFLSCSYKKQGFQAENRTILMDNVKKMLLQMYNNTQLGGLDSCPSFNSTSHSENAFSALQCIIKELKKLPD